MKTLILAVAALLLLPTLARAQNTGACRTVRVNAAGTAGADVVVDGTATGVSILTANGARCGVLIRNNGAAGASMRCAPTTTTVTSTVGTLIGSGDVLVLTNEGQQAWKCIKATGTDTAANVTEAMP